MRFALSVLIVFSLGLYFVPRAHAIIFLPALILIPIAKIIAIIIGGAALPALGAGTMWSNMFGKSYVKTFGVIFTIIFLLAAILAIIFKIQNPDRPWF